MKFPPNPAHPLRVKTLVPVLVVVLTFSILQSVAVIVTAILPIHPDEVGWRFGLFRIVLEAAPQISVALATIAIVGLFGERYLAVRGAAVIALLLGALLVPVLILDALDFIQVLHYVAADQMHAFKLRSLQDGGTGAAFMVLLFWFGRRGLQAGKRPEVVELRDGLVINKEAAPGPFDPRVTN